MWKLLQKKMAGQTMKDDVIPLQMGKERRPEKGNESLLAGGKPVQNGRRIVNGPNQFEFGDIKVFRCFKDDLPRYALIIQGQGKFLGDFLASTVGASRYGND